MYGVCNREVLDVMDAPDDTRRKIIQTFKETVVVGITAMKS